MTCQCQPQSLRHAQCFCFCTHAVAQGISRCPKIQIIGQKLKVTKMHPVNRGCGRIPPETAPECSHSLSSPNHCRGVVDFHGHANTSTATTQFFGFRVVEPLTRRGPTPYWLIRPWASRVVTGIKQRAACVWLPATRVRSLCP